jgi:hypothetical protein
MTDKSEVTKCILCGKTEGASRSFRCKDTYGEVFCDYCDGRIEMVNSRVRRNLQPEPDTRSWFQKNHEIISLPFALVFWYFVLTYLDKWLKLGLFD